MIDITGYDRKRQVRADSDTACDPDLEKYRIKTRIPHIAHGIRIHVRDHVIFIILERTVVSEENAMMIQLTCGSIDRNIEFERPYGPECQEVLRH